MGRVVGLFGIPALESVKTLLEEKNMRICSYVFVHVRRGLYDVRMKV
jgi:hypothetical protein